MHKNIFAELVGNRELPGARAHAQFARGVQLSLETDVLPGRGQEVFRPQDAGARQE